MKKIALLFFLFSIPISAWHLQAQSKGKSALKSNAFLQTEERTVTDMMSIQLFTQENYTNGEPAHDGILMFFSDEYSNEVTLEDAVKPMNLYENFCRDHNGVYLSIEKREMPQPGETYPLFSDGYTERNYTISVELDGLKEVEFYLYDYFTGISTPIKEGENNAYDFSVDFDDPLSLATDRFMIGAEERLDIESADLLTDITLYPNPVNDGTFYINAPKLNGKEATVAITDLAGREMYHRIMGCNNNVISVPVYNGLNRGIYLVTVTYKTQKQTYRLAIN